MWLLHLLTEMPVVLAVLLLIFICVDMLHLIRYMFEGIPYNISLASEIGDKALLGIVGIALELLKYSPSTEEVSFPSTLFWAGILGSVAISTYFTVTERREYGAFFAQEWAEQYHTFVIAPLLAFLLINSLYVTYYLGGVTEYFGTVFCFVVWVFWLLRDSEHGRLNQQKWFEENVPHWLERRRDLRLKRLQNWTE